MKKPLPIIDLFAGPGGLGEGFSSLLQSNGASVFNIKVSIEKDPIAHKTLTLRAIYRHLKKENLLDSYYDYICGKISADEFENKSYVREIAALIKKEAYCGILGNEVGDTPNDIIDNWIKNGLHNENDWVLIGGPPCQAYSLAGRSRMNTVGRAVFEQDHRHLLYKEYLRIITKFKPPIFVMENVKGILSSVHAGELIFEKIVNDLSFIDCDTEYHLQSFVTTPDTNGKTSSKDFLIKSENYGVPQARHRVILLGIRKDISINSIKRMTSKPIISAGSAIDDLPKIRSRLSKSQDSQKDWIKCIEDTIRKIIQTHNKDEYADILKIMHTNLEKAASHNSFGDFFIKSTPSNKNTPQYFKKWVTDNRINGVIQHVSRGHMASDLQRYFFASSYSQARGNSPKIRDFPSILLPNHQNIHKKIIPFEDRFRVQLENTCSTTIVSHISKDGHYYIHYDPSQCRSLTVREAARLQTFPDNYFFEGNRTQQYTQIGNAVPPLLAKQLAEIIAELFGFKLLKEDLN